MNLADQVLIAKTCGGTSFGRGEALGVLCSEIANRNIDTLMVKRVLQIFATLQEMCARNHTLPRELTGRLMYRCNTIYFYLVLMRPGIYLREIVSEVSTVLGLDITGSAVCKFLKRTGFTHHKLATYALQRDDTLSQQFVSDVSLHNCEILLFVDETGTDRKDAIRKYGYSLRGKPLKAQKLLVRGEHISCIAISMPGIVALKSARGSVDGGTFYNFVCMSLLTKLMPFNGTNQDCAYP